MLELLFLLLPIAALYGWYMGQRSVKNAHNEQNNKFSRDYMTGLNFLLSNQQENAAELFLSMLQDQKDDINIESRFEAELTLGNLFRTRGEVDRALLIHQKLEQNPNYTIEQKFLVKQQIAKDFMQAGFFDRAENYYIQLLDEPDFAIHSLKQLMNIYHQMKEWQKAINVGEKLIKLTPFSETIIAISHYYCEYSKALKLQNKAYITPLHKALTINPNCTRASILLGDYYFSEQNYEAALIRFKKIIEQDITYISEVLDKIEQCYIKLNDLERFKTFLIRANQVSHNYAIDLALVKMIENEEGIAIAKSKLYEKLSDYPNIITFHRFIKYQITESNDTEKKSLMLLERMVETSIQKQESYHCLKCGYKAFHLNWFCPSCRNWETIKPIQSITHLH